MLRLIAPVAKKQITLTVLEESDSESENISLAVTSTPVKTKITATTLKITPVHSRNICMLNERMLCKTRKEYFFSRKTEPKINRLKLYKLG